MHGGINSVCPKIFVIPIVLLNKIKIKDGVEVTETVDIAFLRFRPIPIRQDEPTVFQLLKYTGQIAVRRDFCRLGYFGSCQP